MPLIQTIPYIDENLDRDRPELLLPVANLIHFLLFHVTEYPKLFVCGRFIGILVPMVTPLHQNAHGKISNLAVKLKDGDFLLAYCAVWIPSALPVLLVCLRSRFLKASSRALAPSIQFAHEEVALSAAEVRHAAETEAHNNISFSSAELRSFGIESPGVGEEEAVLDEDAERQTLSALFHRDPSQIRETSIESFMANMVFASSAEDANSNFSATAFSASHALGSGMQESGMPLAQSLASSSSLPFAHSTVGHDGALDVQVSSAFGNTQDPLTNAEISPSQSWAASSLSSMPASIFSGPVHRGLCFRWLREAQRWFAEGMTGINGRQRQEVLNAVEELIRVTALRCRSMYNTGEPDAEFLMSFSQQDGSAQMFLEWLASGIDPNYMPQTEVFVRYTIATLGVDLLPILGPSVYFTSAHLFAPQLGDETISESTADSDFGDGEEIAEGEVVSL